MCIIQFLLLAFAQPVAVAASEPLPCESLPPDELRFNEIPSSECMANFSAFESKSLYDRSRPENFVSSDDDVYDIELPFPFRWFGALYTSVFVSTNSYVTFGGGKSVFRDFNAFNPPLPSVLIGAFDNNLQRLTVGQVPQGWLVRFEGRTSVDDQPDENGNCCLSSSELVWELLFLRNGGLQLCTGVVKEYKGDLVSAPVSAVSHQKSASFARTFVLKANFQYSFTTTCAAENRASLSAPISSVTGATLNIIMHLSLSAINVSTWTITLRGVGFSCPPNATVSLISSPPTPLAAGVANILDSSSSSPVLVMSGIVGIMNGSVMMSFTVSDVSTPHLPQGAISNLGFAVHDVSGRIVASGSTIKLDAISPYSTLEQTPLLELSVPTIRSEVSMKITVTPDPATIISFQSAPRALVITVSGSGWHFDPSSVATWTTLFGWQPVSASIVALDTLTHRIRIDFDLGTSRTISSITPLMVIISAIQTPNVTQGSLSNIKCSILNARDSILAAGNRGTLAAITASTMGLREPAISFFAPLRSINSAVLEVRMTPVFRVDFTNIPVFSQPPPTPAVVITLSGLGISCSANTPVTFLMPFTGAAGVANIDSSVAMFPVLRVTITSGSFATGVPIWFQVGPVSTPVLEQPDLSNVSAAMFGRYFGNTILIAASVSGTIDRIVGDMGTRKPVIQHVVDSGTGKLILSFTPSALLPAKSVIVVTLTGVGLSGGETATVTFLSPVMSSSGKVSFVNEPLNSVLIVSVPATISAGTNVSLSVSPVAASFRSNFTLIDVLASVVDEQGKILVAGTSGSFVAQEIGVATTVKDYIMSAVNGRITLPAGVLAGHVNCNNAINETMPPRALGSSVVLTSSGSGTTIDCSSTNMRCLVVYGSSVTITRIVFRGGSSAAFVRPSTLRSIRALYDTAQNTAPRGVVPARSSAAPSFDVRRTNSKHALDSVNALHSGTASSARAPMYEAGNLPRQNTRDVCNHRVRYLQISNLIRTAAAAVCLLMLLGTTFR